MQMTARESRGDGRISSKRYGKFRRQQVKVGKVDFTVE